MTNSLTEGIPRNKIFFFIFNKTQTARRQFVRRVGMQTGGIRHRQPDKQAAASQTTNCLKSISYIKWFGKDNALGQVRKRARNSKQARV